MNANNKISEDYTRTKQDFYRMDLDRMQVLPPPPQTIAVFMTHVKDLLESLDV